jgi:RNA polymerase sigma-70 factor (ECF subfamily)
MVETDLNFQKIYSAFQPRIYRYLIRLVGEFEAEDLTQEVFTKVSQALKDFRGESQLSTWIYRIATNSAMDKLRSSSYKRTVQKRRSIETINESETTIENRDTWTGEKEPSVEQQIIRNEMNQCIRNFIENLPGNYKSVVILSELEGLKNQEIADILQISLDSVKIRLHRARAQLRKKLESNCTFYRNERNEPACDLKSAFEEFRETF